MDEQGRDTLSTAAADSSVSQDVSVHPLVDARSREEADLLARRRLVDEIRLLLLTDRSGESEKPLGLIEQGQLSERVLADTLKSSRIPIREALAVLRALGIVSSTERKQCRVNLIDDENAHLKDAIRCEIVANGEAALERLVETSSSKDDLRSRIVPAREHIEAAKEVYGRSNISTVRERCAGVLHITEAVASLANAARLDRAADVIRSGLDIIEISARVNCAKRTSDTGTLIPPESLQDRIRGAEAVLAKLERVTWSKGGDPDESTIIAAEGAFSNYVDGCIHALEAPLFSGYSAGRTGTRAFIGSIRRSLGGRN